MARRDAVLLELQRWLGLEWYTLDMPHLNRSGANLGIPGGAKAWAKRVLPERAVGWVAGLLHKAREVKSDAAEGRPAGLVQSRDDGSLVSRCGAGVGAAGRRRVGVEAMRQFGKRLAVLAFFVTVGGTLALSQLYGLVVYGIRDALWARRQKRRLRVCIRS